MAGNVELSLQCSPEIIDSSSVDVHTQRCRTPNGPYSFMSDSQVNNVKKNPHAFFQLAGGPSNSCIGGRQGQRQYMNRYCHVLPSANVRGESSTGTHCYLDKQKSSLSDPAYQSSRHGAFFSWGPNKIGEKTGRHFDPEDRSSITMVDHYARPATNRPVDYIAMKYGRPNDGYYLQRYPGTPNCLGSSTRICNNQPKTAAEYAQIRREEISRSFNNKKDFPGYTEYTDSFLNRRKTAPMHRTCLEHYRNNLNSCIFSS